MQLTYRKVMMSEASEVFLMLKEAAEWLRERDIDYWQDWHNPLVQYREWILEGISKGEFRFAIADHNTIIGMFRLQEEDELFWGKRTDSSGYLHSFTTKRKYKGQGIGERILNDIEEMLHKKGVTFIRLDCGAKLEGLCNYYEEYGFTPIKEICLSGESLKLYEKRIAL